MKITEDILVKELKKGNSKAFEELYSLYCQRLYNFCLRLTRNKIETQGMVQDTFIAIWENRQTIDESKSFSGFIFKIARNKCLNMLKKRLIRDVYENYVRSANSESNDLRVEIEYNELDAAIQESIHSLPEKRKQIFLLNRVEGLSYKEISLRLDITENVVDHEIRKALKQIRDDLARYRLS
jgi:RNA polymerase sigma-70 factor (ECF subfamily)